MTILYVLEIGSNKVLLLDYTYHINRTTFQNCTISENLMNNYGLEFILNNTCNEYDLQSVCNGNSYIGIITDLSQVFLAIYDTTVSPSTYTGSENIGITNNEIPLISPLAIKDGIISTPRVNDYFEIDSAPNGISFYNIIQMALNP